MLEKLKQGCLYSRPSWNFDKVKHTLSVEDGKFILNVCVISENGYSVSRSELTDVSIILKDDWYEVKNHLGESLEKTTGSVLPTSSGSTFYGGVWGCPVSSTVSPTCSSNDTV